MKYHFLDEPYLMFGKDTHICPRKGIANYEVFDTNIQSRRSEIQLGAIGLSENIDQLYVWLEKCSGFIPGKKESNQPNLFPSFCGFNEASGFRSKIIFSDNLVRIRFINISNRIFKLCFHNIYCLICWCSKCHRFN